MIVAHPIVVITLPFYFKMKDAKYWIDKLIMQAHPEGGFYKETYRAEEVISKSGLPNRFSGDRNFSTAIYFLLRSQDTSAFHRIQSDELWHFHAGSTLSIYQLNESGLTIKLLGSDLDKGESLQVVVPANTWFGAKVNEPESYTLAGCTVAPGFDFSDFELASRVELLKNFPAQRDIIHLLTSD
jgi:uncharacterized protein